MNQNSNPPTSNQASLVEKTRQLLSSDPKAQVTSGVQKTDVKGLNNILDALLAKGLITIDQYNSIKFESINSGKSQEALLRDHKIISADAIARTFAEMKGLDFIDLKAIDLKFETLNKINAETAKNNMAIVFEETPNRFKVALLDPLDLQKIKYLESILKKTIEPYYASYDDIIQIIDTKYGAQLGEDVDLALEDVGEGSLDINSYTESKIDNVEEAPMIRIINMILDYGIKNKASDIHIEPQENRIVVRFRIRGILYEKLTLPKKLLSSVVTRIKILSNLKIDEHRIPQDGRFQVKSSSALLDVRVSVLPAIHGEKIVMRLLEKTQGIKDLEDLGIRGVSFTRLKDALSKTQGVILVTGPTGSGKTQTLASCLKILNSSEVNIITLEDPVEIKLDGVNAVQVNSEVGLTFASGLRSILRQDPDVIMVGEVRDSETANLAIQAALVGRLVLSTIHTNSSAGAFPRLIDMGVEPFLLSSTVNIVVAQRLVRVLCECKEPYAAPKEISDKIHEELDLLGGFNLLNEDKSLKLHFDKNSQNLTLYKAVGCPKCNDSGYISRTGIFEAMKMSENISKAVIEKKAISEIQKIGVQEGMITMIQDGFIKALEGITTIEEVLRVKNE